MAATKLAVLFNLNILAGGFMVVRNYFAGAGRKAHVCFLVWLGRIRALPPERGCVPLGGTSRSSFTKPAC
jgi:hypothetical protein